MPFKFLRDKASERLQNVEERLLMMLEYDRHEFELAMSALNGDVQAADVNDELRSTDRKVNKLEREIRRKLIVHSSVFGAIDTPAVLIYMSIVKDVERVGDYAKNLLDLALDGADFSQAPDAEEWRSLTSEIAEYITEAGEAFTKSSADRSNALLSRGDELLTLFDDRVSALVQGSDTGEQAVPRALAHRYLKRVVAHLMNMLSAVVMPLHKLDYFDEDPEDRA